MLESFSVLYVEDKKGVAPFEAHHPDMVITDIQMPKMNGIDMTRRIKALGAQAPVIITTAFNEAEYLLESEKDRMIMRAIVSLARSLKIKTVAEFVENHALYEQVQQSGVGFAQGYRRLYDGAESA